MEPYKDRERRITEAKRGINEEKEKQREILGQEEEEVKIEPGNGETGAPKEEEFEFEKLKV